jgi:putative ABC transport system permease protein
MRILKFAWRNLMRDRHFGLLNIVGLAAGLTCVFLIYLWVSDERSIDKWNRNDPRLFQVLQNVSTSEGVETIEHTQGMLAGAIANEIPEVEFAASVVPPSYFANNVLISQGDINIRAATQFVSNDYFNIFMVDFIAGDKNQLFDGKQNVVLSQKLAMKLFNSVDVIGRSVSLSQEPYSGVYQVAAVFRDLPPVSRMQFDAVLNYQLFFDNNQKLQQWGNSDPSTYVLLKHSGDLERFNLKIAGFLKTKNEKAKSTLVAQRFSDRYLYNHFENGRATGGRIEYVRLFTLIAVFILIMACINFMNLSTANASRRMKEVGVRKVVGASRLSLVFQYIGESMSLVGIALVVTIGCIWFVLPHFNEITGKNLTLSASSDLIIAIGVLGVTTGMLAGGYPAFYLSRLRPSSVLKGKLPNSVGELLARKGLVVFQFVLSAILIVAVVVVYRQVTLVQTKNLGYNRDHLVYFEKPTGAALAQSDTKGQVPFENELETFLSEIRNIPGVVNASNFRHNITNRQGGTTDVSWPGKGADNATEFTDIAAGYDFIETMGIEMKEGRTYSREFGNAKSSVIFNEAAIKSMGLTDPIGKIVKIWGEEKEIIGVMRNFHFESLYEEIRPCFIDFNFTVRASRIIVKISPGAEPATLAALQKIYREHTGEPLTFRFLDEDYQALYASEQRVADLSKYFASLAILISCLGLFGLAAFNARRRQKEIGIRKVAGASISQLVMLLTSDFLKLVLLALIIALPFAWWLSYQWLERFAYRVPLNVEVFTWAAVLIITITFLTVGVHAVKAARANPAKTLKAE